MKPPRGPRGVPGGAGQGPGPCAGRRRYEAPVLIRLGSLALGHGNGCSFGSLAGEGSCRTGGVASDDCADGSSAHIECEMGTVAFQDCKEGMAAGDSWPPPTF
ncbi:MAG: hypothetical protein ACE5EL_06150 [Anaerolineae bacterium]